MPSNLTLLKEKEAGATNREIAAKWGLNVDGVRSRVSKAARANLTAQVRTFEAHAVISRPPEPALTDIHYIDPATDQGAFLERLHAAKAKGGYATVAHLCDIHAPYHKRKTPTARWMLGTAIAEVNLRGRDVHLDNLEFQLDTSAVWARYERQTFTASIPQPTGMISFEEWVARKQRQEVA